jgi:predicted aldo/keto reductase-like oxidoreductase
MEGMKFIGLVIGIFFLLVSTTDLYASISNKVNVESSGGNSSVKINNNVNTGSDSYSSEEGSTSTKVEIHQSGEGTSEVNINGKEWKLDGPGDISVEENTDSSDNSEVKSMESEENTENKQETQETNSNERIDNVEEKDSPFGFIKVFFRNLREFFTNLF